MFCRYLWSSIEHSTSWRVSHVLPIIEKDLEFFWVKMLAASSQDRMNRVRSVLLTNVSFWEATIKNVSFWEATIKVQPVSSFLSTWICSIYSSPHNTNISPHNTNGPILLESTSPRVVTNWDRQCWARQKNDKSWKSNKVQKIMSTKTGQKVFARRVGLWLFINEHWGIHFLHQAGSLSISRDHIYYLSIQVQTLLWESQIGMTFFCDTSSFILRSKFAPLA